MTTAIYMRCSTDMQTTESQRHALTEWAGEHAEDAEWFIDEGYSGADDNRPAWTECYNRCKAGEFARLVVWKKDRIGRNMKSRLYWRYALDQFGVELVSITEDDSGNELVDAVMDVVSAFHAEHERKVIGERTRAGIAAKRRAGESWGGGRCIKPGVRGYRRFTDEEEDEIAREVDSGVSMYAVAKDRGVSRATIKGAVKRAKDRNG